MFLFQKDEISLALAVEDFLPVTLFAVGLFFIAKIVYLKNPIAGYLAFLGGALVTFGGIFKAGWKLIQALGGNDIAFLNNSLFVLLSAGFVFLAWAFLKRNAEQTNFLKDNLIAFLTVAVSWSIAFYFGVMAQSRLWFFILLGVTTLANLALLLQLIFKSFRDRLWIPLILFSVNLICIFILARSSDQSVTFQWVKQMINTISQTAFLTAAYLLYKNFSLVDKNGQ